MERSWPPANERPRTVLAGFGNPLHGDDGVGPFVARRIHESLPHSEEIDLLELSDSAFRLVERLAGYRRAVIVDALVDEQAEVGALRRFELAALPEDGHASFHTGGLASALALARGLGMRTPEEIVVYGIVIREPREFAERLSGPLEARVPEIAAAIARAEFGSPG